MSEFIDAALFKSLIINANAALAANVQLINDLNVFPVPDGDTGTNMGLTMANAAAEFKKQDFGSVSAAADCAATALLRGARGNSGVILSLLFRGISKKLKGTAAADARSFAYAMVEGVDTAYKAVMKPAEGTILTVARLASAAAKKAADVGADLDSTLECAVVAGEEALAATVEVNPVLKKAGVVDAGGKGYMVILDTMLQTVRGSFVMPDTADKAAKETAFDVFSTEEITFAFDTVFIVRKRSENISLSPLRAYLDHIGDSLVIGEDDTSFKVHVHTDTPGDALNEAQKYGTLELAKIENMRTQHDDLLAGKKAQSVDDLEKIEKELDTPAAPAEPEKDFGVVAVCAGDGISDMFSQLGVDGLITGGQTMNPSTDDILNEINKVPARTVFVLPNNKNIIMAAQQCIPLTDKKVIVIPSKTIPQGITAMLNYDPYASEEEITAALTDSLSSVHTALVTYAARDSDFDCHNIHAGEYLALLDGALVGSYKSLKALFKELCWSIDDLSPEFISIYYGADVNEKDAGEVSDMISVNFSDAELSVVNGGQPVYYYMISIE